MTDQILPDSNLNKQELVEKALANIDRIINYYNTLVFNREETLDYLFKLSGTNRLTIPADEFELYLKEDSLDRTFESLKNFVIGFLSSIRTTIVENNENISNDFLNRFTQEGGITSDAVDIRHFPTPESVAAARAEGRAIDLQSAPDLNEDLVTFSRENINLDRIVRLVNGDVTKANLLLPFIGLPPVDVFSMESMAKSYEDFKKIIEQLENSSSEGKKIIHLQFVNQMLEYLYALHSFSDAVTSGKERLVDTLSNIFVRLAYILVALGLYIESNGGTETQNP